MRAIPQASIKMHRYPPFRAVALALLACLSLGGCAAYRACRMHACPDDARITHDVEAQVGLHAALLAPNVVYVQTLDRVVYLSGQVDTDLEQRLATTIAFEVPGVQRVVNSIALRFFGH